MENEGKCPICFELTSRFDEVYDKCLGCGLQTKRNFKSLEITNDVLSKTEVVKKDGLMKFKLSTALSLDNKRSGLLDIGTASGKFLFHVRPFFQNVQGIEVNQKCIDFAKSDLGLTVVDSIEKVDLGKVSCVTFWHSLEHIPLDATKDILERLSKLEKKPFVLISVPNSSSNQLSLFGSLWPYYDKDSHLYQFSPKSLNILMSEFNFKLVETRVGLMYELFGYLQGFVNKCHPIANYFYYRKKRGWDFGLPRWKLMTFDAFNYFLISLFIPFSLLALIFSSNRKEGVMNYVYSNE